MKLFAYNGSLQDPTECGSFTVVAREINKILHAKGLLSTDGTADFVLVPECLNARRQFQNHIPILASEYSYAPPFVIHWLKEYNPIVFAISEFAKQNLVNSGYPAERIFVTHLGSNPSIWYPDGIKTKVFSYLTVNSSNDRSGFEELIPAFLEFAHDKSCVLIIKDGKNEKFKQWIESFNSNKLIYNDNKLSDDELRKLYSSACVHLYYNHSTSFGMNINDCALCGTPSLATLGSAPKEFLPEWTQPVKVKTSLKPLDGNIINKWNSIGLNSPPFGMYPNGTMREAVSKKDIISALEYSFWNYLELKYINRKHQKYIRANLTWNKAVDRIVDVLKNV